MLFNFSQYSSLLLIGFVQGVVYSILLLRRAAREDRMSDRLLAALLILVNMHIAQYMLGFAGWYDSRDWHSTFMFYFPFHHTLWFGPVIYFYLLSLTNTVFKFERKHLWHFIPGAIYCLVYLGVFFIDIILNTWILEETLEGHFGTQGYWSDFRQSYLDNIVGHLSTISIIAYSVMSIRIYRKYKTYVNDNFSDTYQIEFKWLRNILYVIIAALAFNFIWEILGELFPDAKIDFYKFAWNTRFSYALMVYVLSILGYSHTQFIPRMLNFQAEESNEKEAEVSADAFPELSLYKKQLSQLMENEKLYLQSSLTLKDLAEHLKTNASVLSKVINTGFDKNFNDYINAKRIDAVSEKLLDKDFAHYTLTSIAFDCGFNSKATFNRAFKKFKGVSPREFIKRQEQKILRAS